jgi:hypothetical protein
MNQEPTPEQIAQVQAASEMFAEHMKNLRELGIVTAAAWAHEMGRGFRQIVGRAAPREWWPCLIESFIAGARGKACPDPYETE